MALNRDKFQLLFESRVLNEDSSKKQITDKIVDKIQDEIEGSPAIDKAVEDVLSSPEKLQDFMKLASSIGLVPINEAEDSDISNIEFDDIEINDSKIKDVAYNLYKNNTDLSSLVKEQEETESGKSDILKVAAEIKVSKDLTSVYDKITKYLTSSKDSSEQKGEKVNSLLSKTSDYIKSLVIPKEGPLSESIHRAATGKYSVFDMVGSKSYAEMGNMVAANKQQEFFDEQQASQARMEQAMKNHLEAKERDNFEEEMRRVELQRERALIEVDNIIKRSTSSDAMIDSLIADDDVKDLLKKSVPNIKRILFKDILPKGHEITYYVENEGGDPVVTLMSSDLDMLKKGSGIFDSAVLKVRFNLDDILDGVSDEARVTIEPVSQIGDVDSTLRPRVTKNGNPIETSFDPTSRNSMATALRGIKDQVDKEYNRTYEASKKESNDIRQKYKDQEVKDQINKKADTAKINVDYKTDNKVKKKKQEIEDLEGSKLAKEFGAGVAALMAPLSTILSVNPNININTIAMFAIPVAVSAILYAFKKKPKFNKKLKDLQDEISNIEKDGTDKKSKITRDATKSKKALQ
tara:strand:- start:160 stop:1890 length:1731 start_codon:yes stop_codon:yes gene_type:complete